MQKHYECSFENGSEVSFTFEVNANGNNSKDHKEILSKFAELSHATYLELGRELNNKL